MKPIVRTGALASAALLLVAVTAVTTGQSVAARPADADTGCIPLTITKVSYLGPDGVARSRSDSSTATVYHLALRPGDDVQETVPPAIFNPLTAPAVTLRAFGFPDRPAPTAKAAAANWTAQFQHYKPQRYAPMCATRSTHNAFMGPWAGIEAENYTDFVRAWTDIRIPSMNMASCASPTSISFWTGIGGEGRIRSGNLIQSGFATPDSPANNVVDAWWEMLNASSSPGQVTVKTNIASAGDLVYSDTWYDLATRTARFYWHNLTTNYIQPSVAVTSWGGYPASAYYDGRIVEWILERPKRHNDDFTHLRQFAVHGWGGAQATRYGQVAQDAGSLPHVETDIYNGSTIVANVYNHATTGPNNWGDQWRSCD